eukprot:7570967-Pyramimonas_sp.AAC.1
MTGLAGVSCESNGRSNELKLGNFPCPISPCGNGFVMIALSFITSLSGATARARASSFSRMLTTDLSGLNLDLLLSLLLYSLNVKFVMQRYIRQESSAVGPESHDQYCVFAIVHPTSPVLPASSPP